MLLPGQKWEDEIRRWLHESDCGLLLISPSLLGSPHFYHVELPTLLAMGKVLIPVGLAKINLEKHDLLGLEERQIFLFQSRRTKAPQCYDQLKKTGKADFIDGLFVGLEKRLSVRKSRETVSEK